MRSVQDQLATVLAAVGPVDPLDVMLGDAVGCILAEDLVAPVDVPAVAVAERDGYAVHVTEPTSPAELAEAVSLPVAHDVLAGAPAPLRLVTGHAVRVASGAPVPFGADAVVPVADTDRGTARVTLRRTPVPGEHILTPGSQLRAGEVVVPAGTRLGARQIGVAASLGRGRLRVHPAPRVVIVAVGDELVEPGQPAREGAVYEADGHALETAVRDAGAVPVRVGIVGDDRSVLRESLEDQLVRADVVLVTGGLSELAHDTVTDVLSALGEVRFDHVAMTPGWRQGFGAIGRDGGAGDPDDAVPFDAAPSDAVPVFALQGDPVAAQVSFEVLVRPALRAMAGHTDLHRPSVTAAVTRGWDSPEGMRQFVPAIVLGSPSEGYSAEPQGDPGRPSAAALARANALVVVPERTRGVSRGDRLACLVLEGA